MSDKFGQQTLESMSQAIWYNWWLLGWFEKYLQGDILEVGCGIGNFTNILLKYGRVTAVDISPDYIKRTANLTKNQAHVGFGDIEQGKFFFAQQKFDVIVCLNVLEHIKNDTQALKNLNQILKPEGKLILLLPSHPFLYGSIDQSINHFRRYQKNKLSQELKRCGFKIISCRRLNLLGALGWGFVGKVLKEKSVKSDKIKIFNLVGRITTLVEKMIEPPVGISILTIAQKK